MTRNQLPEGVGKKIVEALKRQAEADIAPIEESNALPLTEIEDLPEIKYEPLIEEQVDDVIVEEEVPVISEELYKAKEEEEVVVPTMPSMFKEEPVVVEQPKVEPIVQPAPVIQPIQQQPTYFTNVALNKEVVKPVSTAKMTIPPNVATLKNLINSLPVGVTKQTGAQIIRQTLEAMGLPMNNVLKEAQVFQEELNSSTRECMIKIQEYKTQIMQLEASVQEYQQNITQVNDIVSLFLLAEK